MVNYRAVLKGNNKIVLKDLSIIPGPDIIPDVECNILTPNTIFYIHQAPNGRCFISENLNKELNSYLLFFVTDSQANIIVSNLRHEEE